MAIPFVHLGLVGSNLYNLCMYMIHASPSLLLSLRAAFLAAVARWLPPLALALALRLVR